jgi:hypothetical protein
VAADDRRRLVALVAQHGRRVDLQHARALLRHRGEHALRADLGGDERRHAPQRALLAGQAADLGELGLGVALQRALVLVALGAAIGEVDAGGDERDRGAVGAGHRLVRPGDEQAPAVLGEPMADLRARHARVPDVREELAEGLALLGRDHAGARVAADHLGAREARRALARLVEEQDPPFPVQHADERLRRLGEDPGVGLVERELPRMRRLVHSSPTASVTPVRNCRA